MMQVCYYTEGPPWMEFGMAGRFVLGEPREIDDALAEILIRKQKLFPYPGPVEKQAVDQGE
jgi:hypothetical protein